MSEEEDQLLQFIETARYALEDPALPLWKRTLYTSRMQGALARLQAIRSRISILAFAEQQAARPQTRATRAARRALIRQSANARFDARMALTDLSGFSIDPFAVSAGSFVPEPNPPQLRATAEGRAPEYYTVRW